MRELCKNRNYAIEIGQLSNLVEGARMFQPKAGNLLIRVLSKGKTYERSPKINERLTAFRKEMLNPNIPLAEKALKRIKAWKNQAKKTAPKGHRNMKVDPAYYVPVEDLPIAARLYEEFQAGQTQT